MDSIGSRIALELLRVERLNGELDGVAGECLMRYELERIGSGRRMDSFNF
jgi:hypothetical protein